MKRETKMKRIALINDLSGFGRCSLTAAVPVISVMGIQACPLPTAILTAQTGFAEYFCDEYTEKMDEFTRLWSRMEVSFDGIYSGYLADAAQVEKVFHFLEEFQREECLYLADPVLGDNGKPYALCTPRLLEEMKRLVKRAGVITPNLTELCFLAGADYEELTSHSHKADYLKRIEGLGEGLLAKAQAPQQIFVTGILRGGKGKNAERIGNLFLSEKGAEYQETPYLGQSFSGTGDLFASVICASLVRGRPGAEAMGLAAGFLQEAIEEAVREGLPGPHGIPFERHLPRLM